MPGLNVSIVVVSAGFILILIAGGCLRILKRRDENIKAKQ